MQFQRNQNQNQRLPFQNQSFNNSALSMFNDQGTNLDVDIFDKTN